MYFEYRQDLLDRFSVYNVITRELKDFEILYNDKDGQGQRFVTVAFDKDEALVNLIKSLEQLNINEVTK